ncbi:hypothetical protein COCON_G00165760 [Conger conger]|uniref:G-protein coupled receptors family 1 profile domain-containing protein n=1 Tax=Conger conger TaxID=82655 RepID=A0A9Q1HTY4_CONCO|nr:hypothetical protein COCON_G00165760 [Conger conger]
MEAFSDNSSVTDSTFGRSVVWIQLVMAVISVVGSGSIVVFAPFQNLLGTREVSALFFMSLADLLVSFTWLIGPVLLTQTCDNRTACYNLHAVEQIFYISSFFYTLNYMWVLYLRLKEDYCRNMTSQPSLPPVRTCSLTKVALVLSCVLPVLLMVPVFVVGNKFSCSRNLSQAYECLMMHTWVLNGSSDFGGGESCDRIHTYSVTIFVITFFASSIGILVLLRKVRSLYARCVVSAHGALDAREWASLGVLQVQTTLYSAAFAVCWFPAVVLAIAILCTLQETHWLFSILYMLQVFTSPSQGSLNCLLYGWVRHRYRSLKALEQRDAATQTPLLRAQKQSRSSEAQAD